MTATSFVVNGGPRFIDFETVCEGPIEWDLAHIATEAAAAYPAAVDAETLRLCRARASVKTQLGAGRTSIIPGCVGTPSTTST